MPLKLAIASALALVFAAQPANACHCHRGIVLNGRLNTADFTGGVGIWDASYDEGGGGYASAGAMGSAGATAFASARASAFSRSFHGGVGFHHGFHGGFGFHGGMHGWGGMGWGGMHGGGHR